MSVEFKQNKVKELCMPMLKVLLPLDNESLAQVLDYAVESLHSKEEAQTHFINLLGVSPEALKFIEVFTTLIFGVEDEVSKIKPKKVMRVGAPPAKTTAGATPSDLLEVKKQSETQAIKKAKKKTLNSLKDIEAALSEIEVANAVKDHSSDSKRYCNCMGTRHPLFEMFPNCLNCGKIICVKEGLQPCSFCGKELLSNEEMTVIQEVLEREKQELEGSSRSPSPAVVPKKRKERIKVSLNSAGTNNFREQERFFHKVERKLEQDRIREVEEAKRKHETEEIKKEIEHFERTKNTDPELIKARERLDNLLSFQENGVERTKIIDQAADYEVPNSSSSLWASPVERAIQLRKQQKQLRKQEEQEKAKMGRGRRVMSVAIRDGKVVYQEKVGEVEESKEEDQEITQLQEELAQMKRQEDQAKYTNIWNYEEDKHKWAKPMYLSSSTDLKSPMVPLTTTTADLTKVQLDDNDIEENFLRLPGI